MEAGGAVGVNQVAEPGGIGFAGGFALVEPEVYEGSGGQGFPADAHDSRGRVPESEPLRRIGLRDARGGRRGERVRKAL